MSAPSPRLALVLAGGGARGAYEVGVLQHLVEHVLPRGAPLPFDVLSGTSVGAINVCALGAFADDARVAVARLAERWEALEVHDIVRISAADVLATARDLVARPHPHEQGARPRGLVDATGLHRLVREAIPFARIDEQLRAGHLGALTVSTTHVASGRTAVFVHGRGPRRASRPGDGAVFVEETLRAEHALASAAIPLLFPAVRIDGEFHCDGGLRQNVPLSPARRLGADRMVVVNPRRLAPPPSAEEASLREDAFPGPLFLLGKTLNALMLDRLDHDLDRLERINAILDAGTRRFGPGFADALNAELGARPGEGLRRLSTVLVRASADIGRMSADHVRTPRFASRVSGVLGAILGRLADGDGTREADLLSYLLFDGAFARDLMALGREDARAAHDRLAELVAPSATHAESLAAPAP